MHRLGETKPRADIPRRDATGLERGFSMDNPSVNSHELGAHGLPRHVCTCQSSAEWLRAWTDWVWEFSLVSHGYHIHHKRRARAWPAHVRDKHVNLGSSDGVLPRKRNNNVTLEC